MPSVIHKPASSLTSIDFNEFDKIEYRAKATGSKRDRENETVNESFRTILTYATFFALAF